MAKAKKKSVKKVSKKNSKVREAKLKKKRLKRVLKREDKQLIWFFSIIAFVFILFLGIYFYQNNYMNNFNYAGVKWEKVIDNKVPYWHSKFKLGAGYPIYNAWLRNDPRTIKFPIKGNLGVRRKAVITYDSSVEECQRQTSVMGVTQGIFLSASNIKTNYTYVNPARANLSGLKPISCENASKHLTVYLIKKSNQTEIVQNTENSNCYEFRIAKCEDAIPLGERFIIGVLGKVSGKKV